MSSRAPCGLKKSINTVDPECVKAKGRKGTHASYNIQVVTDDKNGLIVSAEAVSESVDLKQFSRQMKNAEETLGKKAQTGRADAGYSSVDDLENVEDKMNVIVPTAKQTNEERHGVSGKRFEKSDFDYYEPKDFYYCPAGKILNHIRRPKTATRFIKPTRKSAGIADSLVNERKAAMAGR